MGVDISPVRVSTGSRNRMASMRYGNSDESCASGEEASPVGRHDRARPNPFGRTITARVLAALLALVTSWTTPAAASPEFRAFVESLWPDAEKARVSRATFDRALRNVVPDLTIPDLALPGRDAAGGQAEFTRPPQAYVAREQIVRLAEKGRALATQHRATLDQVEKQIGVDAAAVLAIWGRETAYGAYKPTHYAIRVLATLAWTGRRKDLFRAELIDALRLIEDGTLKPEAMKSSWAGAMGLTQFMPSEFYSAGHDLDGNGRVDLFGSIPDALGSAAKQLKQKGWIFGLPWGFEVTTGSRVDCAEEGPANARPLAEWMKLGVTARDRRAVADQHARQSAYLMSPAGTHGPQFLVTENFKVIRAYNMSDLYALFVGHLADRIAGGGDFATRWKGTSQSATRDIEDMQKHLQAAGFSLDKVDGKIGSVTRGQIGLYQRRHGLTVDCWPSTALLEHMRHRAERRGG
jgi:lytic murein transglycosylase